MAGLEGAVVPATGDLNCADSWWERRGWGLPGLRGGGCARCWSPATPRLLRFSPSPADAAWLVKKPSCGLAVFSFQIQIFFI